MSEREFERKVKEWLDKGYSNSDVIHTIECNYLGTCIVDIKFYFTEKYNRNDYYIVSLHCLYNIDKKEVEVYCNMDTDLCPKRYDINICSKCTAFDSAIRFISQLNINVWEYGWLHNLLFQLFKSKNRK